MPVQKHNGWRACRGGNCSATLGFMPHMDRVVAAGTYWNNSVAGFQVTTRARVIRALMQAWVQMQGMALVSVVAVGVVWV